MCVQKEKSQAVSLPYLATNRNEDLAVKFDMLCIMAQIQLCYALHVSLEITIL